MNQEDLCRATQKAGEQLTNKGISVEVDQGTLTCRFPDGGQVVVRNTLQRSETFDNDALLTNFAAALVDSAINNQKLIHLCSPTTNTQRQE